MGRPIIDQSVDRYYAKKKMLRNTPLVCDIDPV